MAKSKLSRDKQYAMFAGKGGRTAGKGKASAAKKRTPTRKSPDFDAEAGF